MNRHEEFSTIEGPSGSHTVTPRAIRRQRTAELDRRSKKEWLEGQVRGWAAARTI